MKSKRLILASQSPRRKELLSQAGFDFDIMVADIDEEDYPADLPLHMLPGFLAEAKAKKIHSILAEPDRLVLAADSLVFLPETIHDRALLFTKPVDRADAIRILSHLSDKTHTVITGVCLMDDEEINLVSVYTSVTFDRIAPHEMEYYIDTYQPYDKAGAYGIQDWIGICKVTSIQGSYSNIMGLPLETVYNMLKQKMNVDTNS